MEELKKQLFELQNLTVQLDYISGLVYTLRGALGSREDDLNIQYTMASAYISNLVMEFEKKLDTLLDEMLFSASRLEKRAKQFLTE